jgi:predicted methyltransferase
MAVTHTTAARDAATNAVTALIGGTGNLTFRLTGTVGAPGAVVATLPLSATAFGASSTGTATANAITSDTNAAGNASPVANAALQTGAAVLVIHCAVAASASDINMTNGLTITAGDTVTCTSLTYTALSA